MTVRIRLMAREYSRGLKKLAQETQGIKGDFDAAGDASERWAQRAGRSAERIRTAVRGVRQEMARGGDFEARADTSALDQLTRTIRRIRAEMRNGATFTVRADGEGLNRIQRAVAIVRANISRGATLEVRGDTSGLTPLQTAIQRIRTLTTRGADFVVRGDASGLSALHAAVARIRVLASRGADFVLRGDARGLSVLSAAMSRIRGEAGDGARFVVRGVLSGFSGISGVFSRIRSDAANGATFRIHADTAGVVRAIGVLTRLDERAAEIDRRWGHSVTIHANPSNIDEVVSRLRRLGLEATRVNDTEIDIPVDVHDANARTRLEAMRALVRSMSSEGVEFTAGFDDAVARAQIAEFERRLNEIDGRNIRINTSGAGSAISSLANSIRSLSTIAKASSIPFLVSGIAGIVPVAGAAVAGVGALASAVGRGLVGAMAAAGGAAAGMAGGVGLIAAAVGPTVSALGKHEAATKAAEGAQKAADAAAKSYADTSRQVGQAVAERGQTEKDVAQATNDAWASYQRQQEETAQVVQQVAQDSADAWNEYISTREKTGQAEQQAAQASADAAREIHDSRVDLMASTAAVVREQREYNQALFDEPRSQAYAALDLADARDRLSDATRQYNQDVAEYGATSEKATDSLRAMQRAELDLQKQQQATTETQKNGSEELRGAFGELVNAQTERGRAAVAVQRAEENADRVARQGAEQVAEARKSEASAYEAYRRMQAQGAEQIRQARQAEADQYKSWQRTKEQGDRQLQAAQDAVTEAQRASSQAAEALAVAQREAGEAGEEAGAKLTASQSDLLAGIKAFKAQWTDAIGGANDDFNYLAIDVMKFASGGLPALGEAARGAVGGLAAAFATLRGELTQSDQLGLFNEYLSQLPTFTQLGVEALGRLGLTAANVFIAAMPAGERFLTRTNEIFAGLLSWTRSLEGQTALRAYFDQAADAAAILVGVVADFGIGLIGLGGAFAESGLTTYMLEGLANLAAKFREGMSVTGEWRAAVVSFSEASMPILDALRGLVGAAVTQVLLLADNLVRIKTPEGAPLLVTTLGQIADALPHIRRGLEAAFTNWGPLIGPAIQAAASFFEVFIANNPVLHGIVRGIIGLVNWFTQLPMPIQQVVVAAASGLAALNLLGAGALLLAAGPLFRLVTSLGGVGRIFGVVRTAAMAVGTFLLGPWGLAIAAAIAAGVLLWQNWDAVKAHAAPLVAAVRGIATQGLQFLQARFAEFRAWWAEAWPQIRAAVMPILSAIAGGIRTGVGTALSFLIEKGRQLVAWFRENWPAFRAAVMPVLTAIASGIRTGVGAAFSFLINRAGQIVSWFRENWPLIKQTAKTTFDGLVAFVRGGITAASNLIRFVWGQVMGFWRRNNDQIVSIARSVWNIVRNTIDTGVRIIGQIVELGMNLLSGNWRAAWANVGRILRLSWDLIKANVGEALKIVGNLIRIGWTEVSNRTSQFGRFIKDTVLSMWNYVSSRFTMGKDHAIMRIREMAQWIGDRFVQFRDFVGARARELWDNVSSRFTRGKDHAIMRIREMTDWVGARWTSFRDFVGTRARELWDNVSSRMTRGKDHAIMRVREMTDWVGARWREFRDYVGRMAGELWDNVGTKFRDGVNKAIGFINSLGNAIEKVAGFIGLEIKIPDIPKLARGGVTEYARGGVETGRGQVTGGVTAIAGEAGREAIVPLTRRTPEGQHALRVANAGPNATRPRRREEHQRHVPHFANGGVLSGFNMAPNAYQMAMDVSGKFNVPASTYSGHGAQANAATSVDWPVGPWGYNASPEGVRRGNAIADYLGSNWRAYNIDYIIWNRMANYGYGKVPYEGGGGYGYPTEPSGWHTDHVHASVHAASIVGKLVAGAQGAWGAIKGVAGSAFSGVKDALGNVYNDAKDFLAKRWKPPSLPDFGGYGDFGKVLTGGAKKLLSGATSFITKKAEELLSFGDSGGAGGGATPGGPGDYGSFGSPEKVAKYMAGQAQARGLPGELPVMTSLVESELMTGPRVRFSDLDSAGPFQVRTQLHGWSVADAENYGLATNRWFLDNAQRYKGAYDHSAAGLGAWAQRVQGSAYPGRYQQRYDQARRLIGYHRGGVVPGMPGEETPAMLKAGEIVLPGREVRDWTGALRAIERRYGSRPHVGGVNPDGLGRGADLTQRNDLLERQNALLEEQNELLRSLPEETGKKLRPRIQRIADDTVIGASKGRRR